MTSHPGYVNVAEGLGGCDSNKDLDLGKMSLSHPSGPQVSTWILRKERDTEGLRVRE